MENFSFFSKLLLALFLGSIIGLEREQKKKGAGLQTYALVSLGACLFSLIAFALAEQKLIDPTIVIMAIGVGVGFIGGGAISREGAQIFGLTTAAGIWTTAAIGLAVGAGFISLAIFATFLTLLILVVFGYLEKKLF